MLDILKNKYPEHELFNEKPHLLSRLIIDGTSHITHILTMAQKRGIKCIAITDHNTTIGSLEAQSLSEEYGIIVVPGIKEEDMVKTLLFAALFGLTTYATYDLTSLATLDGWSIKMTIIDLIWGTFISTLTTYFSFYIAGRIL